ncbi:hypothetical protein [Leptospira sp. GIMC2001]|uniref:hypothetical protein n=1 Tax=Leptospira sp. GIMC2001 TaxID=1513297 RepID=UPI002349408B|nr:hypothetical protein [Leptospira sp. GIMC2001]WCL48514.1 hypothetical protein O4O04_14565 [Leptospira sp. GIMC2001]
MKKLNNFFSLVWLSKSDKQTWFEIVFSLVLCCTFLRFTFQLEWWDNSLARFDWDQHFFYLESVRKAFLDFHEMPFWNPYYVGGIPIIENPQIKFLSPTNLFSLVFGSIKALKISVVFYSFIGFFSSLFLFRRALGFGFWASLFASTIYSFCGWHSQHVFAGHSQFFSTSIVPIVFGCLIRYYRKNIFLDLIFSALGMLLLISEGNIYIFLFIFFLTFIFGIFALITKNLKLFRLIFYFTTTTFVFCSYRIIPEVQFFLENGSQYFPDTQNLSISNIWTIFTGSSQHPLLARNFEAQQYQWWEYGNYIGYFPFIILFLLLPFFRKKDFWMVIFLSIALVMMLGDFHELSPFAILRKVPGYSNMRIPSRWSIVLVFFMSLLLGHLIDRFHVKMKSQYLNSKPKQILFSLFSLLIFSLLFYDLSKKNAKNYSEIFIIPEKNWIHTIEDPFFTVSNIPSYGADSSMLPAIIQNFSVRDGYENLRSNRSLPAYGDINYRGEYFLESKNGTVSETSWSMSNLEYNLSLSADDRLIINRNFSPNWRINGDYEIFSHNALIAISLKKGNHIVRINYMNTYFIIGTLISILGFIGCFLFLKFPSKHADRK